LAWRSPRRPARSHSARSPGSCSRSARSAPRAAGAVALCRNASNEIATCSSSLRYKTDVTPFTEGFSIVDRLEPIGFAWKDGGLRDVGFAAEAVAAIDPRLAIHGDEGRVEGVKYDRLTAVLVNAVKELREQNASLQRHNAALEDRLATLERLVVDRR
jgi:hypothetical protein